MIKYQDSNINYIGNANKIYIGDQSYIVATEESQSMSRLPQGYTEVEYVENTTQAYLNLDVYLNTSNFEVGYDILGSWISWGYTHQVDGSGTWITVESSTAFFGNYNNGRVSITTDNTENVVTFASTSGITVNSVSYSKTFQLGNDSIASIPLYVFGRYDFRSRSVDIGSNVKLKSFYLKNDNTLVRYLVPCTRDSDSMVGMYDIVNDVFYYPPNYTSYQLVAGPEVSVSGYKHLLVKNESVAPTPSHQVLEYIQCGNGNSDGGVQLLTNVTSDYYFEVESKWLVKGSGSPNIVSQKSKTEIVGYQMGLCYYGSSMFLDYGGSRLSTSINQTTQMQKHKYSAGHISGSSNPNRIGVMVDDVVSTSTNGSVTVENLPYLVGELYYSGHTSSDVFVNTQVNVILIWSVKIYEDYGETLIGDYIPVRTANNIVTLYDKISGNYATPYGVLVGSDEIE